MQKRRIRAAFTGVLLLAGITTGIATGTVISAPAASAATPTYQLCNGPTTTVSILCLNRKGGGTAVGTPVIAYSSNDSNNDFRFTPLTKMCGSGKVTTTCPFTLGGGLNDDYEGSQIVVLENTEGTCVGTSNNLSVLTSCPDSAGVGGGNGTIDILAGATSYLQPGPFTLINRASTDSTLPGGGNGTVPLTISWPTGGIRNQLVMNDDIISDNYRDFYEITFT